MCIQKAVLQEPPLPSDHRVISQDTLRTGLLIADILDQLIFWAHLWETSSLLRSDPIISCRALDCYINIEQAS